MKQMVKILVPILCLVLLGSCGKNDKLRETQDLADRQAEENKELRKELTLLNDELKEKQRELSETQERLLETEESLKALQEKSDKEIAENKTEENETEEYQKLAEYSALLKAADEKIIQEEEAKRREAAKKAAEEAKKRAEKAAEEIAAEQKQKAGEYGTGITYEQLARTPDKYKKKKVYFIGAVVEVVEKGSENLMLLSVHKTNGKFDTDQILYCVYKPSIIDYRLLEKDIVTIYGVSTGITTYQAVNGRTISIPSVKIEKIELNE